MRKDPMTARDLQKIPEFVALVERFGVDLKKDITRIVLDVDWTGGPVILTVSKYVDALSVPVSEEKTIPKAGDGS